MDQPSIENIVDALMYLIIKLTGVLKGLMETPRAMRRESWVPMKQEQNIIFDLIESDGEGASTAIYLDACVCQDKCSYPYSKTCSLERQ